MNSPKILLIRFSAIGDCAMTAWAATSIRKKYPDAIIHWVVEPRCKAVLDTNELVDEIILFPRQRWKRMPITSRKLSEQKEFFAKLRSNNYDWGIDFQGHSKTSICLRVAKVKKRLMVKSTDAFASMLNPVMKSKTEELHTVERNHQALLQFGDFEIPKIPIMPKLSLNSIEIPSSPLVTIAVGAGQLEKTWPIENWEKAAGKLASKGVNVAFIGGPEDPVPNVPGTMNCVNKLPLDQTIALISKSSVVFCGDTGAGHIAAAYGVPGVSIFGPTSPTVFRPYSDLTQILKAGDLCTDVSIEEGVSCVLSKLRIK